MQVKTTLIRDQFRPVPVTHWKSDQELQWDYIGVSVVPTGKKSAQGKYIPFGSIIWYKCKINGKLCLRQTTRLARELKAVHCYYIEGVADLFHSEQDLVNKALRGW